MTDTSDFIFDKEVELASVLQGSFSWESPSNIALIKYWGKKENQIPANASVSFTLSNCKTITTLTYKVKSDSGISFDLLFDGEIKEEFKPKVQKFFESIVQYCPYVYHFHFTIDTRNTFPHSSGIASSASGMAALAVNIMSLEKLLHPKITEGYFDKKASFLARLGSGSACRSISGSVVVWGQHPEIEGSSDLYGVSFPYEVHDGFKNYRDVILLADKGEKKVSSTTGHGLMHNHPFAKQRFIQATENLSTMSRILKEGDVEGFIQLVESEALTLHAMMMTSVPYFMLMKPNTLQIIEKIWNFRKQTKIPVCFTLDAGANVHVLFPEEDADFVMTFIRQELAAFCDNEQYIEDKVGFGSERIK